MSDNMKSEIDPVAVETVEVTAGTIPQESVGAVLRAAREAAGLTQEAIADRFKLRIAQVQAVESDQWEKLSGRTFARGLVRGYAKELNLDAELLASQVMPDVRPTEAPIVPPSTPSIEPSKTLPEKPRKDLGMVLAGLVVLVVSILAYFLWPVAERPAPQSPPMEAPAAMTPPQGTNEPAASSAVASTTTLPPAAPVTTPAEPSGQPLSPNVVPLESLTKPATPTVPQPVPGPMVTESATAPMIHFTFTGTSWVEVRDRQGSVILSFTGSVGQQKSVSGQGPFSLHIGNAAGVKLTYKGQPVDLPRSPNTNSARVKLD